LPAVAASQAPTQRLTLDTYDPGRDWYTKPAVTKRVLTRGRFYVVTARGTFSFYSLRSGARLCGQPEARPLYRTPRAVNRRAVADPEFFFADPMSFCGRGRARPPRLWTGFQISLGGRYSEVPRPLGAPATPSANHSYRYAVRGAGKRAKFRLRDYPTRDNYGRIHLRLRVAKAKDCAAGQYTSFAFATELKCIAAVAPGTPVAMPSTPSE
jgi:hypothetical protein